MAQQPGIVKGDVLQRLGSISFIVGAIVLIVFNILFPRVADPSNTQEMLKKWGDQKVLTQLCALLIAVGFWAVMIGAAGVYRSITAGAAAVFARLGFYGVIVGTTIWTVNLALVMATAGAAADWVAAPAAGKAAAYSVAAAIVAATDGVYSMSKIVFWLALVFVGIGMALSKLYPRWLGWVAIALGVVTMAAVGIVEAFAGRGSTLQLLFAILALLSSIWVAIVGIWVARKAW